MGTLETDIASAPAENNLLHFGTTFSYGSKIYEIEGVDSFFRIAVDTPDGICLAQNVASTEGNLNIKKLFERADFKHNVEAIKIFDHFQREKLSQIKPEDMEKLIDELSLSSKAELENEDYEKIARSQSEEKSFKLVFKLKDSPDYTLYIIPEMNISMIGDSRLYLPHTFNELFNNYFEDLKQGAPLMY